MQSTLFPIARAHFATYTTRWIFFRVLVKSKFEFLWRFSLRVQVNSDFLWFLWFAPVINFVVDRAKFSVSLQFSRWRKMKTIVRPLKTAAILIAFDVFLSGQHCKVFASIECRSDNKVITRNNVQFVVKVEWRLVAVSMSCMRANSNFYFRSHQILIYRSDNYDNFFLSSRSKNISSSCSRVTWASCMYDNRKFMNGGLIYLLSRPWRSWCVVNDGLVHMWRHDVDLVFASAGNDPK